MRGMKKIIISLVLVPLLLLSAYISQAIAENPADLQYERARVCYHQLKTEPNKADSPINWKKCIKSFQKVTKQYPKSSKAAPAAYSAARLNKELYLKTQNIEDAKQAIRLYNLVIKDYPKSNLADDALFQIGLLRQDPMQQKDRAYKAFKVLLNRYPNADMVSQAKQSLANLGEVTPAPGVSSKPEPKPETKVKVATKPQAVKKVPPPNPDKPFALSTLYRYDVDTNDQLTVVTLYMNQAKPFTRKFEDFGLRTKSPAKLTLTFPRTKIADSVEKKEQFTTSNLREIKLKHGFFSGDLVARFELPENTDYDIKQNGGKTIVKFFSRGTTPAESSVASAKSKRKLRIVIDPGHGGEDHGAVGPKGLREKEVTLSVSKKLAYLLRKKLGAKVYLTRTTDRTLTLEQRNQFANQKKADLFLSIHANAVKDRSITGVETFYLNNASDEAAKRLAKRENRAAAKPQNEVDKILLTLLQNYNTEESRRLAKNVHGNILDQLQKKYSKIKDRKLRSALFYVLVGAKCPGILIETSYISNPLEEKRLGNTAYQRRLAEAVADGVKAYVEQTPDMYANL